MRSKITSFVNPKVNKVIKLRDKRHRKEKGLTIVEGIKEISMALDAKTHLKELFVCPKTKFKKRNNEIVQRCEALKIPIYEVTEEILNHIAYGDRNEGVLAVCEIKKNSLYELKLKKTPFLVLVESVEKPGNLGAILRTSDAVGADGVIVCNENTDIHNPNVIRASLGAIFSMQVITATNENVYSYLKERGIFIYAATPYAKKNYIKAGFQNPCAVVLGSEQKGLSDFWIQKCDFKISIPMKGKIDSLNVSVSAAILLYEVLRQRTG